MSPLSLVRPARLFLTFALAVLTATPSAAGPTFFKTAGPGKSWRAYFQDYKSPGDAPVFKKPGIALEWEQVEGFVRLMERAAVPIEEAEKSPGGLSAALERACSELAAESRTARFVAKGRDKPSPWPSLLGEFEAAAALSSLLPGRADALKREHAAALATHARLENIDRRAIGSMLKDIESAWARGAEVVFVEKGTAVISPESTLAMPRPPAARFTWKMLQDSPLLAGKLRAGSVRLEGRGRAFAGGMALVVVDPDRRGVFYKIAYDDPDQSVTEPNQALIREASSLIRLRDRGVSEGIPRVLAVGLNPNGRVWVKLEGRPDAYEAGSFEWNRWSARERVAAMAEAARILGRVHRAGFIHNDIKPENILVNESRAVMIADLGIANVSGESTAFGTEEYAPPEWDARYPASDVYSFGKVLEFLFNNALGDGAMESSGLSSLVAGMTLHDREMRRPQDMEAVAVALERARDRLPEEALGAVMTLALRQAGPGEVKVAGRVEPEALVIALEFATGTSIDDEAGFKLQQIMSGAYDRRVETRRTPRALLFFDFPRTSMEIRIPFLERHELARIDVPARVPAPAR